ncbi:polysaccharide deacetylase family protein [Clostridium swellfunianum]|uniref:polysaccharide deacetylase family protein n=1 Tax=Clostridium swellfunianum TaxID=1367462 RepID=UPI00202EEF3E|nr:polysaccharide deacetylase family protein [Clostridium swellfunianum]MCM0646895.1 polysaccharide deacetylase family protein [Clostridium swellfunianum]
MSDKVIELEENSKKLNLTIDGLEKANEELHSKNDELLKNNEKLKLEMEDLKSSNKKLLEDNSTLKKQNIELENKLEASLTNKNFYSDIQVDKLAYLTFDDGPSDNTPKILDILKENNIKATFFVNGHPERKEIYKRIISEGHVIGNHTYSHDYAALYKTIEAFDNDKQKLDNFIFGITGIKPQILRFPGGSNNRVSYNYGGVDFMSKLTTHIKQSGIKYFDWNVDSTDASVSTQSKDKIISGVLNGSKGKKQAVILMHDSNPKTTTVLALPSIIKGLKEQGFRFSILSSEVNAIQFK